MGFSFTSFSASTISSSDLNSQFSKIENKFGNIKNADLANDASITSEKLLDRYCPAYQTVVIGTGQDSVTAANNRWGGLVSFEDQATVSSMKEGRIYPEFPGKRAYLIAVSISISDYVDDPNAAEDAKIEINHNGTTVATFVPPNDNANQVGYIRAGAGSSAFSSPITSLQTGDYLGFRLGMNDATGTVSATASCVAITFTYKVEITP